MRKPFPEMFDNALAVAGLVYLVAGVVAMLVRAVRVVLS